MSGTLNNCLLKGNSATSDGGGAFGGTLNNCTLVANSAINVAGGAYFSLLNNCTLVANSAGNIGGGAYDDFLTNCIIYFNTSASGGPNYNVDYLGNLNFCCTTPQPLGGVGNITNAPLFVNQAGGNLHLQTNSPCINAGNNAYAPGATDLDGNPRIVGGTVDIGAYEFQFPTSVISYQWLQYYGLPTDGSADYADTDGSGMNNWQDWIAGTNPTNAASALRMLSVTGTVSGVVVSWRSVTNRSYSLERATNLGAAPAFWLLGSNIAGLAGATTFTDTNAVGAAPRFYRVLVEQ